MQYSRPDSREAQIRRPEQVEVTKNVTKEGRDEVKVSDDFPNISPNIWICYQNSTPPETATWAKLWQPNIGSSYHLDIHNQSTR